MNKLFRQLQPFLKNCFCRFSSQLVNEKNLKNVDLTKKIVYGGDLPIPTSRDSVGSILFNRLRQKEREDEIFQICTKTKVQMTTKKYLEKAVAVTERLTENGIKKGDLIVLVGNNSLNMNVALLGIFLLGAVPFPLSHKTTFDDFKILMSYVKPQFYGCDKKYLFFFKRALQEIAKYDPAKMFLLNHSTIPVTSVSK